METCATCKHWYVDDHDVNDALGRSGEPREGGCDLISDKDSPQAFIDWSGPPTFRHLRFVTREDFGCVLWESR